MLTWLAGLFASPWMLAWLPAAAVPVLIHLWHRRKYRQVTWAAMEYLLAALVKSSRRMRIEQWLLLAVRTLVILLAVLALSEPLVRSLGSQFVAGARTHHVLVLDGSFTMDYRIAGKSLFELGKERARQIVDAAHEGDAFTLVLMSDTPRVIVGHAAFDRTAFLRELDALTRPDGGGNVPAALEVAERLVIEVGKQYPQLVQHHVYFLTDLCRNRWGAESRGPDVEKEFRRRLERLSQKGSIEVAALGASGAENLAVTSLTTTDSYATPSEPITVQAVVRNFGSQRHSHQRVELWVDDQRIADHTVDVPAGEAGPPVTFTHRFETPGDHVVEVRAPGDALAVDNRRLLVVPVKEHLRALCISGKQGSTRGLFASLFGVIRVQEAAESALLELDLKQFDCVFLANVGQFTASEAHVLDSYLKAGGGLIFFLGDQVLSDRYNRELGGQAPGSVHVLPALLGETVTGEKYFYFDALDYRHPLLRAWKGNPQSELLTAPAALKYFRLKVPEKSRARVALAFNSGDPAIVEETIHRGRSIVVATAASIDSVVDLENRRAWSLMSASGSLFPLVRELCLLAVGGQIEQRNVEVGQPIGGTLPTLKPGAALEIRGPGGRREKVDLTDDVDAGRWTYSETDLSGVYTALLPERGGGSQKFAANVDTRYSDLARLNPEDLPREFVTHGTARISESATATAFSDDGFTLHLLLLCLVLTLLFAETMLAWWLGNRAA